MNTQTNSSLTEIQSRILEIQSLNLNLVNIDDIKLLLGFFFTGYTLTIPIIEPGLFLFRGISYETKPDKLSYLSYPPKEKAKINRASREHDPFFYCATARQVPFFELNQKAGDRIVLSKWRTNRKLLVNHIGYTDPNFSRLNSGRENYKGFQSKRTVPDILKEKNDLIQNFLAETFSQEVPENKKEIYKLTIAIAEKHYSEDSFNNDYVNFEGILYPTIQMNANADNIALSSSFVDSGGLDFVEAEYIEVKSREGVKFEVTALDWANSISDTGIIEWKGRLPQWTFNKGEQFFFTIEDGRQVARNEKGEIIEPH